MRVLVACEESQRVCMAFRDKGHEAYSCDIIDCSGGHPEWHIKGDAQSLVNGSCSFTTCDGAEHSIDGKWDMIIAFPPCTYLSNAGARWLYPKGQLNEERYKKGLAAKEFFLSFLNADCERVAVENPISSKIFEMPQHTQEIQPYQFGHPYTKKTRLWLRGLPTLKPTNIVDVKGTWVCSNTSGFAKGGGGGRGEAQTAKERSKTFEGVAAAMAEQWG